MGVKKNYYYSQVFKGEGGVLLHHSLHNSFDNDDDNELTWQAIIIILSTNKKISCDKLNEKWCIKIDSFQIIMMMKKETTIQMMIIIIEFNIGGHHHHYHQFFFRSTTTIFIFFIQSIDLHQKKKFRSLKREKKSLSKMFSSFS